MRCPRSAGPESLQNRRDGAIAHVPPNRRKCSNKRSESTPSISNKAMTELRREREASVAQELLRHEKGRPAYEAYDAGLIYRSLELAVSGKTIASGISDFVVCR
jgi:hypothetical protein